MHVAVCIVGYRSAQEVAGCVAALARCSYADFVVVVRENGGEDARQALSAVLPSALDDGQRVTLLEGCDNRGFAGGVNACIAAAGNADAWWVLNPDARPEAGALAALVGRLATGDVAAAGGVLYLPDGTVQAYGGRWRSWLARAVSLGNGQPDHAPVEPSAVEPAMDYILGASMLIGRRFVDRVGLMREDYFLYGEEIEWFLRARRAGVRLGFAPDARVLHAQGATTGSGAALRSRPRLPIYLDERNKLNIVRDTTPWRLPVAAVAALLLGFARFARRGAIAQQRYALAGWGAGLRGERGPPPFRLAAAHVQNHRHPEASASPDTGEAGAPVR